MPLPRLVPLLLLAMTLFTIGCVATPERASPAAAPAAETPGAGESADGKGQCVQGCQRWGEACNVDPRGVYRCRRVCEKFGEVCE